MDFMTYKPMIGNISTIISSLIKRNSNENLDMGELLAKCDPIGYDPHLQLLATFNQDNKDGGDAVLELYNTVLSDTPVARYFSAYFNGVINKKAGAEVQHELGALYEEEDFNIITYQVKKLCLEDFHAYTQQLGGDTAEIMGRCLSWEADRTALEITRNSFDAKTSSLNEPTQRSTTRRLLYCNFGNFYPEGTNGCADAPMSFSRISDEQSLLDCLQSFYRVPFFELAQQAQDSGGERSFTDCLDEHEVRIMEMAFRSQSHLACFYGWFKLKIQELRNIKWILECIESRADHKRKMSHWIPIFDNGGGQRN
jgi:V-type H+-transporting ATPase subunit d